MTCIRSRRPQARRSATRSGGGGGGGDVGLTLIELVVALMVAFVAVSVLAGVFVGSLHTLTVAKQRQSATALGTRAMEQMRALPFSALTSGLSTGDLAGDPAVTGTPPRFKPLAAPTVDEVLQTNTPSGTAPTCGATGSTPLLPHLCPTVLDGVTYTVASYVSQVPSTTPTQYSLTTIVSWSSPATRGKTKTLVNRSRAFSPNGTCTPANHPFNTPCQSQYYASAGLSEGGVTVSGAVDGQPVAPGLDVLTAELSLPRLSTTTTVEQTVTVGGATAPHTARLVGASAEDVSGEQALSSAATDPSNTSALTPTASAAVASTLTRSGGGWSLTVAPEAGGTWTTTSRAAAGANSGCRDANGAAVDGTSQPCGSSSNEQAGPATVSLTPAVLAGRQLPALSLARIGAPAHPSRAFGARFTAPQPAWCPTGGGSGCVAAGAARELGATVLGGLPSTTGGDVVPAGFLGAVLLDGHTASASASSGAGAKPPAASRTGTLRTYNGASYTTTDLALATAAATLPVSVVGTYTASGSSITVSITGTVQVTPRSVSPAGCVTTVCNAETGTVVADLVYDVQVGTTSAARFQVRTDAGALLAKSSFKPA